MGALLDQETRTYAEAWGFEEYADHSPGAAHVGRFLEMAGLEPGVARERWRNLTILDAGAGSGKGALALQALGFGVELLDITPDGLVPEARGLAFHTGALWTPFAATAGCFDYVYCCDVLEHLDESMTMLAIARMLEAATRGLFLSISLVPDQFGILVGRPLHLTVRPFTWWRDRIRELGALDECRDLIDAGLFYVRPR